MDNGLIEKLRWDRKYALTFIRDKQFAEEVEKIKRESKKHQKIARKEGKLEGKAEGRIEGARTRAMEIAKNLLRQGVNIRDIRQATGISAQWIGRLKSEIEANE